MKKFASSPFVFENIDELLEEIRETIKDTQGLTQARLAKHLGKSRGYFNRILNGKQKLDIEMLMEILNCLGMRVLLG